MLGRLGIREETDKWKLFREMKGRIAKSVEEKIEGIKTERLKNQKPRRCTLGQLDSSSVSDSEDPSESSQSQLSTSDKSGKGETLKTEKPKEEVKMDDKPQEPESKTEKSKGEVKMDDKPREPESDGSSHSQGSSPERSMTPIPPSDDLVEEDVDIQVVKRGKGLKNILRRKKGKTKNERDIFEKTIAYSELCDNESDTEVGEFLLFADIWLFTCKFLQHSGINNNNTGLFMSIPYSLVKKIH